MPIDTNDKAQVYSHKRWGKERIVSCKGALAFYNQKALGEIIDIGPRGLAFNYIYAENVPWSGPFLKPQGLLDIVVAGSDYCLRGLPASVVVNFEIGPVTPTIVSVTKWLCSLRFHEIVNGQAFLLKRFLQSCTRKDPH